MRALLAALAALLLGAPALAQTAAPALDRARLAAFVDGAVATAMRNDHIAGVSVAIVDREGIALTRGYGMARANPYQAEDADTLVRVASISKTPTWIAIMQLVEQGKLTLDDPVNDHLPPELQIPDEGFSEPIRVRNLLAHNAGFEDSALGHLFARDPATLLPMTQYLARYRVHRVREPGQVSVYSNYGAALAGAIVAHESGIDWPTYVEQRILRPLGMQTATYRDPYPAREGMPAPMPEAIAARTSTGFFYTNGAFEERPWEYTTQNAPAGGLSVSANEMALYIGALLDPARLEAAGVLRAATLEQMRTPLFSNIDTPPGYGPIRHGFLDQAQARPIMGFGHDGDLIYQHSLMAIYPELGLAVFISVNNTNGYKLRQSLVRDILAEFYNVHPTAPTRAENAAAESARVAGVYLSLRRPYFRTERAVFRILPQRFAATPEGDLLAVAGLETRRLVPQGDGVFADATTGDRIVFREVDGKMRVYDPFGVGPSDRIGFFQTPDWLLLIALASALIALWQLSAAVRDLFGGKLTIARSALAGLSALWLVAAILLTAAMLPWLNPDQGVVLFGYPGPIFPLACWLLLASAIATPLAALAVAFWRPKTWKWFSWLAAAKTIVILGILAVTLWDWGFLGYQSF